MLRNSWKILRMKTERGFKMDLSNLSTYDWIQVYENLQDEGHLNEEGLKKLQQMRLWKLGRK